MLELLRNKKLLVVVAHPDDELLGIGGTLNRLVTEYNVRVKVVILGEGITSRADQRDLEAFKNELINHQSDIVKAKEVIGYQELSVYQFPDNRFDSVSLLDIIKIVEKEKKSFTPDYIFTHHGGDVNIDHQRTNEAVLTAIRPMEHELVKGIFTFETPSGTEWRSSQDPKNYIPNIFIGLEEQHIDCKIQAMECYSYEKRTYPHPRSPKALKILAQNRGLQVGYYFAETLCLIRMK